MADRRGELGVALDRMLRARDAVAGDLHASLASGLAPVEKIRGLQEQVRAYDSCADIVRGCISDNDRREKPIEPLGRTDLDPPGLVRHMTAEEHCDDSVHPDGCYWCGDDHPTDSCTSDVEK